MNIDFICLGVMKCGTTSLDAMLRGHPSISMPTPKELHFFGDQYKRGMSWYLSHFETPTSSTPMLTGEVGTHYFAHEQAAEQIHRELGNPRFIVLLRDPIDRSYSHWKHDVMVHGVRRSFPEYVQEAKKITRLSCYGACLERYLSVFPINQFLFIDFEELVHSPHTVLEHIGLFLDIDPLQFAVAPRESKTQNVSRIPRWRHLYRLGSESVIWLDRHGFQRLSHTIRSWNIGNRMKISGQSFPPLTNKDKAILTPHFEEDLALFTQLSGCRFPWIDAYLTP